MLCPAGTYGGLAESGKTTSEHDDRSFYQEHCFAYVDDVIGIIVFRSVKKTQVRKCWSSETTHFRFRVLGTNC